MVTFYDSLPLNVVRQLIKVELMETCKTTEVEIKSIEFDDNVYGLDEDPKSQEVGQRMKVTADVKGSVYENDNGIHSWVLEWSADMCQFISVCRDDQCDAAV